MLQENGSAGNVGDGAAMGTVESDPAHAKCPVGSVWKTKTYNTAKFWRVKAHDGPRVALRLVGGTEERDIQRYSLLINYLRCANMEASVAAHEAVDIGAFGIETASMLISPARAESWLAERNPEGHNRSMSQHHIRTLAEDILGGHWKMTHQGVAFDKHSLLKDGQHRLAACVLSNKSIWMRVTFVPGTAVAHEIVTGNPPANVLDFDIGGPIDCGRYRSPHVQLGLQSAVRNFDEWKRIQSMVSAINNLRSTGHVRRLSAGYIEAAYARMGDGLDWALRTFPRGTSASGPAALLLARTSAEHRDAVERFASIIVAQSWKDDTQNNAFHAYECIKAAGKGDTSQRRDMMKRILRWAMAFCRGEKLRTVQATDLGMQYFGLAA